jgi:hypothetical protein
VPTISDAAVQLNRRYDWSLPTADSFVAGSKLREIWLLDAAIADAPAPLLFAASTGPFALSPALSARFVIHIEAAP